MYKKRLMVANWKMFGSKKAVGDWLDGFHVLNKEYLDIVVCPPLPYLNQFLKGLHDTKVHLGAQNVASTTNPSRTGEVSAEMIRESGCSWVIIGHSERREFFFETDECVLQKLEHCLDAGLSAIVCVGETFADRNIFREILSRQIQSLGSTLMNSNDKQIVLAYEPVWAIGTGQCADVGTVSDVHLFIRNELVQMQHPCANSIRIIYGGGVTPSNAKDIFALSEVDGALVGSASRKIDDFHSICHSAASSLR